MRRRTEVEIGREGDGGETLIEREKIVDCGETACQSRGDREKER